MSAAAKLKLTPQEYLEIERRAAFKSEYFQGEMFPLGSPRNDVYAMAGASYRHTLVKDNLARKIGNQLENSPCRILTSDLRVKVEASSFYTYPDLVVVCEEPKFEDAVFDTLLNPRVIIEILSDSTEKYDRGAKFRYYRSLASFEEYVLVAQNEPLVEIYLKSEDRSWVLTTFAGLDAELALRSMPVRVPLTEVYSGVKFPIKGSEANESPPPS